MLLIKYVIIFFRRSRSRGSSVNNRHNNGTANSSSATGLDGNNVLKYVKI
jgi:hypothetical protein